MSKWGINENDTCEKQLEEYRMIEDELNQPRSSLGEIAVLVCETLSCENCPVVIHKADTRTDVEKCVGQHPCFGELRKWIIKEASKQN